MAKVAKIEADAYICEECQELTTTSDAEEVSALYECGDCGERYGRGDSADGESNRCPQCGKFGAKIAEHVCPECGTGELSPLVRADAPKTDKATIAEQEITKEARLFIAMVAAEGDVDAAFEELKKAVLYYYPKSKA